jgi:topoisomerase-4 subunit A
VRARYEIEEMARGAWQLVFTELPPGVSSAKVLSEIGVLLNPQPRPGKKAVEQSAAQLKALMASQLDRARDESGKDDDIRLVFEPSSSRIDRKEFVALLLAHTSLETSAPINLVAVGIDGRPCQKSLVDLIGEWCTFRLRTVFRRTEYRLQKADDRIHILEGRHIVFLNIDEVIRIIRESDDPKAALIARFILSDRQAEDILEIRLRQLARLEGIRIEQELAKLRSEREGLLKLLGSDLLLRRQVIREIKADAEKHGDARRTIIETAVTASRAEAAAVTDEPVTVIISEKGWARVRQGHGLDLSGVVFKDGDRAGSAQECRSIDSLVIISTEGRAFTVAVASLPDGRGMGAPLSSFVELGSGRIAHVITGRRRRSIAGRQDLGLWLHLQVWRPAFAAESGQGFPHRRRRCEHPAAAPDHQPGPSGGTLGRWPPADFPARTDEAPGQRQGRADHRPAGPTNRCARWCSPRAPRVTIRGTARSRTKTLAFRGSPSWAARPPRLAGRADHAT